MVGDKPEAKIAVRSRGLPQSAHITMQEALAIFFYVSLLLVSGLFCNFIVSEIPLCKTASRSEPQRSDVLKASWIK